MHTDRTPLVFRPVRTMAAREVGDRSLPRRRPRSSRAWLALRLVSGALAAIVLGAGNPAGATEQQKKVPLAFACYAGNRAEARQAVELVRSIRAFAGSYAKAPISVFLPDSVRQLTLPSLQDLASAGADVRGSQVPRDAAGIPWAGKVYAAGVAELIYSSRAEQLVWMDPGSLVLQEPKALLLPVNMDVGYRPVDLAVACSPADSTPDSYWRMLYGLSSVGVHHPPDVQSTVDQIRIRACFNDGLFVERPTTGVLQCWSDTFARLYANGQVLAACEQDHNKFNALHEAALSCAATFKVPAERWVALSDRASYPLWLQGRYPEARRAKSMDEIVSVRCGDFFQDPKWKETLPASKKLTEWLDQATR